MRGRETRPLRVEQAFEVLPTLEVLAPLYSAVIAASGPDPSAHWSTAERYSTLGKRVVDIADLRDRLTEAIEDLTEHLSTIYQACVQALEAQRRGDAAEVVRALASAGDREARVGRTRQARAWYESAMSVAARMPGRGPEISVLLALGDLELARGRPRASARSYQRASALAESELDQEAMFAAYVGLGRASLARGEWDGAAVWYERAEALAGEVEDEHRVALLERQMAVLARRRDGPEAALGWLSRARERLERMGDMSQLARVLTGEGRLESELGRSFAAAASLTEALALARGGESEGEGPEVEVEVRLRLAEQHLAADRPLEAVDEMRRVEALAIGDALLPWLVRIYTRMGASSGRLGNGNAFVFFEQALELCRFLEHPPLLEARVYHEYGEYCGQHGEMEEGRAYHEQADSLLQAEGYDL